MTNNNNENVFSLKGKKGLIFGIANDHSIAYGCAKAMRAQGAELAATYLNEKAKQYVEPLTSELGVSILEPCDLRVEGQLEAVFAKIEKEWGKLDFVLHSLAFATKEDLHGRVTDCSRQGFMDAMDISCHSFIRMARLAEPLMKDGGTLLTVSFSGSERVVDNYNMMGPVKAALECATRYVAAELGPKGINVNIISSGPIATRAASGINKFDDMMEAAARRSPLRRLVALEEVGSVGAYLVSNPAKGITGEIVYVDAGYSIMH